LKKKTSNLKGGECLTRGKLPYKLRGCTKERSGRTVKGSVHEPRPEGGFSGKRNSTRRYQGKNRKASEVVQVRANDKPHKRVGEKRRPWSAVKVETKKPLGKGVRTEKKKNTEREINPLQTVRFLHGKKKQENRGREKKSTGNKRAKRGRRREETLLN